MKAKRYPEIPHVHARLFGEHTPAREDAAEPATWADAAPPPPPFLAELIAARVATRKNEIPSPGRVVLVRVPHPQLPHLISVLLDREEEPGLWHGWVVTPDADYAGPGDVSLQDGADELDLMAVMAQTWNPVQIRLAWLAGYLGSVSPATRSACAAALQAPPLTTSDADRRAYIGLYQRAAGLITESLAERQPTRATGLARLAEALAAWAATTGTLLAPSHWVPEPMHGTCAYDAQVIANLVELQFFDAGGHLTGLRLRLQGPGPAIVDLEQDGHLLLRKTLRQATDLAEIVLPTAPCDLCITGPAGTTLRLPLPPTT
jgi:hypothetical protein